MSGDPCCPFWRRPCNCAGWPGNTDHDCTANEDGNRCLLFPKTAAERTEARDLRLREIGSQK